MLSHVALALSLVSFQQTDTTVTVRPGSRLELRNNEGDIRVTTWDRDAIRIAVGGDGGAFRLETSGSVVRVRAQSGRWRRRDTRGRERFRWDDNDGAVSFTVRVPPYVALALRGNETGIAVAGTESDIVVENNEGSVDVRGGRGRISVRSVEGAITILGAVGRVDVTSGDGDIELRDITGDISAESVDGSIIMTSIDSRVVEVGTVDGDVSYSGTIYDGGLYALSTHDGDVTLTVPPNVNADVTVANFEGSFETNFPVVLRESERRRLHFTLGSGGAEIRLEAFDGDVFLRRSR